MQFDKHEKHAHLFKRMLTIIFTKVCTEDLSVKIVGTSQRKM